MKKKTKVATILLLIVIISSLTVPASAGWSTSASDTTPWIGYCNTTAGVNIRSNSNTSSSIVSSLGYLEYIQLIGGKGSPTTSSTGWWKVLYAQNKSGYASSKYINSDAYESTCTFATVNTTAGLNIRRTAGTGGSVLCTAPYNAILSFIRDNATTINGEIWCKVVWTKTTGWVSRKYLTY